MVLGVVGGSFSQCSRGNMDKRNEASSSMVVAQVGDSLITDIEVDNNFKDALSRDMAASMGTDIDQLRLAYSSVNNLVQSGLLLELAKKYGVQPNDEEAIKQVEAQADAQLQQMKFALIAQKMLPEKASESEFAAAFKKQTGEDPNELRDRMVSNAREALKHPETKLPVQASTLSQPLLEAMKKGITITDDELSHQNDAYTYKQITLLKGDVDATAKKVMAELKGGASFESLIDKYSNDLPEGKKKLSETTHPMSRSSAQMYDYAKPLTKLKVGEVSEPVTYGQARVIYKMISIKAQPKADFEKQKASIKDSALAMKATEKLIAELKELQSKADIIWKSEGHRLVYDYGRLDEDQKTPKAEKYKTIVKIVDDALKVGAESVNPFASKWANVVAFDAFGKASLLATPAEKTALEPKKIDVYRAYLQTTEDTALRIELVKSYMAKKEGVNVSEQLISAANANLGHPDLSGQSIFNEINKYLKEAQDANLLKPEVVKQVEGLQRDWVKAKAEKDKFDAEDKKIKEQQAKEQAAFDKQAAKDKADADAAAKAAEAAAKKDNKTDPKKPAEGTKGK